MDVDVGEEDEDEGEEKEDDDEDEGDGGMETCSGRRLVWRAVFEEAEMAS